MASLFFTISDIALFIGMNEEELRAEITCNPEGELSQAYYRGKLKTKIRLRFDSKNYALHGSPDAMKQMREYLSNQQIDENA